MQSSAHSARQQAAAKAGGMRLFVRGFFASAGLIALLMVIYVVRKDMAEDGAAGTVTLDSVDKLRGNGKGGPILPAREPHAGHSHSHDHSASADMGSSAAGGGLGGEGAEQGVSGAGVHNHNHDIDEVGGGEEGLLRSSAGSSAPGADSGLIERSIRKVLRKTTKTPDGHVIIEETVYYTAPSEDAALQLAQELVKDGSDVTIREGSGSSSSSSGSGSAEGDSHQHGGHSGNSGNSGAGAGVDVVEPVKPAQPPPKPAAAAWKALEIPGGLGGAAQRPIPGERDVTSHSLQEATQHSMNPPRALADVRTDGKSEVKDGALAPAEVTELEHRLVVAIANGVHSGSLGGQIAPGDRTGLAKLPLVKVLLNTLLPVAQPHFVYRFYFAYDHNDPVYEKAANREAITAMYKEAFEAENAKRWHPAGYVAGSIDGSTLVHSVHWVHCDYAGKPSWAHSDAVVAAYKEGADYTYRTNDDAAFPPNADWADKFITDLRGRNPIPNLGVVGPTCHAGATWILTHDFTHKTHVAIFGWQYPRGLPDWSSDDWVTYVYQGFNLMSKLADVTIEHTQALGTRYNPTAQHTRLAVLNDELRKGSETLVKWLKDNKGVEIPHTVKNVECC